MFVPKNDPNSIDDIDLMGVFVAPLNHYFGFGSQDVKDRFIGEWDVVSYEVKKFVQLLVNFNPNVVSLLWLEKKDYLYLNPLGEMLVKSKEIFNSKKAYHTFTGYAHGQFQKMTSFNQEAFFEIERREQELLAAGCSINGEDGVMTLPAGSTNVLLDSFRQYSDLKKKYFSGYMGKKRKALVLKHGYDTKNAAHLIRLLRMGIEFLDTGILNVRRSDSEELLEIKQGKWTLEEVKAEAEALFAKAKASSLTSKLPEEAKTEEAEKLCMKLISLHHGLGLNDYVANFKD